MSSKTIVIQPGTTRTVSPRRLLVSVVSVLAVAAAIVFGSMASNESVAVTEGVDRRVDYALRHMGETSTGSATALAETPDYLARYLARNGWVSDLAEPHRSPDYGVRHIGD